MIEHYPGTLKVLNIVRVHTLHKIIEKNKLGLDPSEPIIIT